MCIKLYSVLGWNSPSSTLKGFTSSRVFNGKVPAKDYDNRVLTLLNLNPAAFTGFNKKRYNLWNLRNNKKVKMFVKPRVFDVDFEPSNGVFYAGQNVTGNVHLVTDTFIHQLTGKTCPIWHTPTKIFFI